MSEVTGPSSTDMSLSTHPGENHTLPQLKASVLDSTLSTALILDCPPTPGKRKRKEAQRWL